MIELVEISGLLLLLLAVLLTGVCLDRDRADGMRLRRHAVCRRKHSSGRGAGDDDLGQQRVMDDWRHCRCSYGWVRSCSARDCRKKCFAGSRPGSTGCRAG